MKLNATSMGKLFDLMLMGLKYQVLSATQADEVYFITMKHLDTISEMITDEDCKASIKKTAQRVKTICQSYSAYHF